MENESQSASDAIVTLRVPRDAWDLLFETLAMDAQSGAFDPALRAEISHALASIEEVDTPLTTG